MAQRVEVRVYKSPRSQWVIPEAKSPISGQTDGSKESELKQYIQYFSLPQGSTLWKGRMVDPQRMSMRRSWGINLHQVFCNRLRSSFCKSDCVVGSGKAFLSFTLLTFIKFQRSSGWLLQERLITSILEAFIYNKDN